MSNLHSGANLKHVITMQKATIVVPRTPKEIKLTPSDKVRFWAKVNKDGPTTLHMESPCWLWTASKNGKGYGYVWASGKLFKSHRVAWIIANGTIPKGVCALHRCDNPSCVNPTHLFIGTNADNMRDMAEKRRKVVAYGNKHGSRTHPESRPKGECQANAKLTNDKVVHIRAIYAEGGITKSRLATKFDVSRVTISRVIERKRWAHVKQPLSAKEEQP